MTRLLRELTNFIIALIEIMLVFRFILKLLGANPAASFVNWVYEMTQPLLSPFLFAFPTPSVRGGFTLEFTTLFAIFAYAFAGFILQEILEILEDSARSARRNT